MMTIILGGFFLVISDKWNSFPVVDGNKLFLEEI